MYKTIVMLALVFFVQGNASAQNKLTIARTQDNDGYTNVRTGKGANTPIITKLDTNDFFFFHPTMDNWAKIKTEKFLDGTTQIIGYVHRNRIQLLDSLDAQTQKNIITAVFNKEIQLYKNSKVKFDDGSWSHYHQASFDLITYFFENYYYKTQDTSTLKLFFQALIVEEGCADETPFWVAGACYAYHPENTLEQVRRIKSKKDRGLVYGAIEFGLQAHFYRKGDDGDKEPASKQYRILKNKLDKAH